MATLTILALFASVRPESAGMFPFYFFAWLALCLIAGIAPSMRRFGARKWPTAEATVTGGAMRSHFLGNDKAEIDYSYNFDGNSYTGVHRERVVVWWDRSLLKRFPKGRTILVRVRPGRPEVSIMRDADQTDSVRRMLERIDEEHEREKARHQTRA